MYMQVYIVEMLLVISPFINSASVDFQLWNSNPAKCKENIDIIHFNTNE